MASPFAEELVCVGPCRRRLFRVGIGRRMGPDRLYHSQRCHTYTRCNRRVRAWRAPDTIFASFSALKTADGFKLYATIGRLPAAPVDVEKARKKSADSPR